MSFNKEKIKVEKLILSAINGLYKILIVNKICFPLYKQQQHSTEITTNLSRFTCYLPVNGSGILYAVHSRDCTKYLLCLYSCTKDLLCLYSCKKFLLYPQYLNDIPLPYTQVVHVRLLYLKSLFLYAQTSVLILIIFIHPLMCIHTVIYFIHIQI